MRTTRHRLLALSPTSLFHLSPHRLFTSSTSLLARKPSARTPLIKFLGPRAHNTPPPQSTTSSSSDLPRPHPESPTHSLPDSFVNYRIKAVQHGPLGGYGKAPSPSSSDTAPNSSSSSSSGDAGGAGGGGRGGRGAIGGHSGHELGSIQPGANQVFDRSELPARFGRMTWSEEEIEAVEMGGAGVRVGWGGA